MKNKKLLLSTIIIIICLLIVLFGLPKRQIYNINSKTKNKTLTLWVEDSDNTRHSYFNHIVERFNIIHPDIDVQIVFISGNNQKVYNFITTEIINKKTPDIILVSLENYNRLVFDRQLYPLNDYINNYPHNYFFNSSIEFGKYKDNLYGISYHLNPEILVYRKDFLSSIGFEFPDTFYSLEQLTDYVYKLDDAYQQNHLNKISFSVPTLISGSHFYSSLLNIDEFSQNKHEHLNEDELKIPLDLIKKIYTRCDTTPYYSAKTGIHPFFNGQAVIAIEPLSLVYSAIDKDKSLLRKIGIGSINGSPLKFSYSNNRYISVFSHSKNPVEAFIFLDFFFSEKEVLRRYHNMNVPIMIHGLEEAFVQDSKFNNTEILPYLKEAFHYNISPGMPEFLHYLDNLYEKFLHHDILGD